jgi:uroporphyrinogen decarboxylase
MTSRERVFTALNHEEPDRVPLQVDFTPEIAQRLSDHFHLGDATPEAYSGEASDLPLVLGHDLLVAWHGIATGYYLHPDQDEYTCEWGIKWRWVDIPGGRYTDMIEPPLAAADCVGSYRLPDPTESWRYTAARELIAAHGKTHVIVGAMPCTTFEACWYLRGLDQFLIDLMERKDFANELLDKVIRFQLVTGTTLATLGVDILWLGDDFGTQNSLILSPAIWREFFKPRYAQLIAAFKQAKPDLKIAYHSDGNIEALLPEFIEVGVDIFNAVQPLAINQSRLKKRFGKHLSYWGGVDIQEVLPHGSPHDVEQEVKLRLRTLGKGGGYILGPSHNIQPDVPLENILAFYQAAKQFGRYPLS